MARKPAIPAETLGDWFKEYLAGALNWTDLVARVLHAHAAAGRPGKIAEGAIVTWPPIKGECLVLHVTPRMRYCTIEYIPPKGGRITAHGIKESELSYVRSATEDDFSAHAMRAAALGRD